MTEKSIIEALARFIDDRKYPFQLPNSFIYQWESDYWAMDAKGNTKEFEIKISRADFFKDASKSKHLAYMQKKGANYFYYVCPEGLIKPEEVSPRYGLIYIGETDWPRIIKKPSRLNKNQFDQWKMLALKMHWKFRGLWRKKLIDKEISLDEYYAGFNHDLSLEFDSETCLPLNPES